MVRWRCCWPPGRSLARSNSRCSGCNAAADPPRNATAFCCGADRRDLCATSHEPPEAASRSCSAHFSCCLSEAASHQQRLERPGDGTKIIYEVRQNTRDRPRAIFSHCRLSYLLPPRSAYWICFFMRAQVFDPQQRAARLGAAMDGHVSVLLRSWRRVPCAHVVATLGRCCPPAAWLREIALVRAHMRAVLAATDALYASSVSPVDVPVKKFTLDGVYMSRPLTSTVPKRNLSV